MAESTVLQLMKPNALLVHQSNVIPKIYRQILLLIRCQLRPLA